MNTDDRTEYPWGNITFPGLANCYGYGRECPSGILSVGSYRKQENLIKTSASLTMLKPLTLWITANWKTLKEMGIPDHLNSPKKPV